MNINTEIKDIKDHLAKIDTDLEQIANLLNEMREKFNNHVCSCNPDGIYDSSPIAYDFRSIHGNDILLAIKSRS